MLSDKNEELFWYYVPMIESPVHRQPHKSLWRKANFRMLPSAVLFIAGAVMSHINGNARSGSIDRRVIALLGVVVFIVFAIIFLQILTKTIFRHISIHHLSPGRAAAIQFLLRLFGYIAVFLTTLDLLGIPIGKLLLGGAALGIILGVAAQQALANFFASIVLIIAHPFAVGQQVTFSSGVLGGKYIGEIKDIGLTHTKLDDKNGHTILLPNATLLSVATITMDIHTDTANS